MNKIVLTATLVLLAVSTNQAIPRCKVQYGIESTPESLLSRGDKVISKKNLIGIQVGPVFELNTLFPSIQLTSGILYSQHRSNIKSDLEDYYNSGLKSLEASLGLRYDILPFSFSVGSNGIFLLSNISRNLDLSKDLIDQIKSNSKPYGINLGLGIECFNRIQLSFLYKYGLFKGPIKTQFYKLFKQKINEILGNKEKSNMGTDQARALTISIAYPF